AGHCPHDEVPDIVNSEIINWLEQVMDKSTLN
ncbi:MAG: alpha/beta hydrolase, partial [Dolichospermum sp.]|nr:alpha/beta hydrolase [Dolichospermum sp.]